MMEKLLQHIDEATSVRGAKRAAGWIYRHYWGQKGADWGQNIVMQAVIEKKTQIKGERPKRRARGKQ